MASLGAVFDAGLFSNFWLSKAEVLLLLGPWLRAFWLV